MKRRKIKVEQRFGAVDDATELLAVDIRDFCSEELTYRATLCLSEALSNLIKYCNQSGDITVSLEIGEKEVLLEVFDPPGSNAFDPFMEQAELGSIPPEAECGRGVALIKYLANEAQYFPSKSSSRMQLKFVEQL